MYILTSNYVSGTYLAAPIVMENNNSDTQTPHIEAETENGKLKMVRQDPARSCVPVKPCGPPAPGYDLAQRNRSIVGFSPGIKALLKRSISTCTCAEPVR